MARLLFIAPILGLIMVPGYTFNLFPKSTKSLPDLDVDAWWGPSELEGSEDCSIKPFNITFDEEMLNDLKLRLNNSRTFVPPYENGKFDYGFNTNQIGSWLKYWSEEYPFYEREEFLNQYPQYQVSIGGLKIHYIRVTPEVTAGVEIVPVMMIHGWPGSVREFYEAIPFLTAVSDKRDFAIELIIPSIPGFGFSDGAARPGLGTAEIAVLFEKLMQKLGFEQYYVQGGDLGSAIASNMATLYPKKVLGYHTNMPLVKSISAVLTNLVGYLNPRLVGESAHGDSNLIVKFYQLKKTISTLMVETGFMHIQATKPDTVGVGLTDSPAGLLAYLLEKFSSLTDMSNRQKADGGLSSTWTKDQLIDNLMIYWTSNSITTSARLYAETFNMREINLALDEIPTSVPTWALQAKHEIAYHPEYVLKKKYTNFVNTTVLNGGGHFLAFELPELFSKDIVTAITEFRRIGQKNVNADL